MWQPEDPQARLDALRGLSDSEMEKAELRVLREYMTEVFSHSHVYRSMSNLWDQSVTSISSANFEAFDPCISIVTRFYTKALHRGFHWYIWICHLLTSVPQFEQRDKLTIVWKRLVCVFWVCGMFILYNYSKVIEGTPPTHGRRIAYGASVWIWTGLNVALASLKVSAAVYYTLVGLWQRTTLQVMCGLSVVGVSIMLATKTISITEIFHVACVVWTWWRAWIVPLFVAMYWVVRID